MDILTDSVMLFNKHTAKRTKFLEDPSTERLLPLETNGLLFLLRHTLNAMRRTYVTL